MNLSKNFTLDELTISEYAERHDIPNTPPEPAVKNLRALCENVLQPLRDMLGRPVVITSGYRSPELNKVVGGSPTSQHMSGQAADIIVVGLTPEEVFSYISENSEAVPFDQLIEEFGKWVHVSYRQNGRRERLLARRFEGTTKYIPA